MPPASAINAASDRAHAFRILQVRSPSFVWCIGQIWPGSRPGQHLSSSIVGTPRQQNATGAAATPANWQVIQTATTRDTYRRANDIDTSA
jgi:hypothetical protein